MREFHHLLTGEAREWYWLFVKTYRVADWPTLQQALQRRFSSYRSDFEIQREPTERKQQPGESVDAFFHAMGVLRSRLRNPIAEYEAVKLFKCNLRESLARMVYPMPICQLPAAHRMHRSRKKFPSTRACLSGYGSSTRIPGK
ncbi:PREDICTED: uncharacterized protein LOC108360427 [Rhagoletis zephyria]|uniref:uncharacterized protein LOC108360427 n=1 Tax=Rhagoletis zephyria TaxID=28612 RepID=UPI0008113D44|nr:PREDICTED: uncharacterized protein LOC108360427 [Rhagoletis zephyria]